MSNNHKKLSRTQLFELVWQTPLVKLAVDFGISDRGLAKLCTRYQIPLPGIGYWRKLQVGQTPKKKSLPALSADKHDPMITIHRTKRPNEEPLSKAVEEAINFEKDAANIIAVDNIRELSHSITKKIIRSLSKKKTQYGVLLSKLGWMSAIRVSPQSIERALKILDTLLLSLVGRGHKVLLLDKDGVDLELTIFDEKFKIRITEHINHVRNENNKDHLNRWEYVPTGRLRFEYEAEYTRGAFSDTPRRNRLEQSINAIIIRLLKSTDKIKALRIAHAEQKKSYEIERRIWEEKWRQEQLEKRRLELLTSTAKQWSAIKKLDAFIQDIKANLPFYQLNEEQVKAFDTIINWTQDYINKNNSIQLIANILNKFD